MEERFLAKRRPVRVNETRQNKNRILSRSDPIGSGQDAEGDLSSLESLGMKPKSTQ
jgi:hypothetical protein